MSGGQRIGVLGIGIMGFQIARRLAEAGHRVRVWNRTREKAERLVAHGAQVAASPAEAVADASCAILMLSDGPACERVLHADGVLAALPGGATLVVMSSIPVETAREQAVAAERAGVAYLDAPVSGGERGATDGTLAIMAGGEPAAFERMRPILERLGRPTLVGPAGSGQLAKLCNQLIVAGTIAMVAEAMLLAKAGGADLAAVRDALLGGFADSTVLKQHAPRMIQRDFQPGGPAKWQVKDTTTVVSLARSLGLELPVAGLVDGLFRAMVANGDGELDHSGLIRELERRNRLPVD